MSCYIQAIDVSLGVWFWIALVWSWYQTQSIPGAVTGWLILITVIHSLTDIWSIVLGGVVALSISHYIQQKSVSLRKYSTIYSTSDEFVSDVQKSSTLERGRLFSGEENADVV